jgi:hypothetical protein
LVVGMQIAFPGVGLSIVALVIPSTVALSLAGTEVSAR